MNITTTRTRPIQPTPILANTAAVAEPPSTQPIEADSSFEPASVPGLPGSTGPTLSAARASTTWVGVSAAKRVDEWCALGRELAAAQAMPPSAARTARIDATQAALTRLTQSIDGAALMATLRSGAGDRRLGFMVQAVGVEPLLTLGQKRGVNVNEALAMSDTVRVRGLTTYESRQVEKMFGRSLDPNTVRFNFTTGLQTTGAGALVMGNTVNVDPSDRRWGFVPGTTLPADPANHREYNDVLLAHEMTHVWSYQHRGSFYAVDSLTNQAAAIAAGGSRGGAYTYVPNLPSIRDFNEEQRAMVVQDYRQAQAAAAQGTDRIWLSGQAVYANPKQVVTTLQRYIDELNAAGPGQPQQPGPPQTYACTCHSGTFAQDGILGFVGANADAVLGSAGPAIMNALQSGDVGSTIAGGFGVGVAVAASLLRREQQGDGGGSDVFDQAGLPRGVSWNLNDPAGTTAAFSVRAAWDVETGAGLGAPVNPRVELDGAVRLPTDTGAVSANGAITVGADGFQGASVGVRVDVVDTTITASASAQLASSAAGRTDNTITANLGVASGSTAFSVGGSLRSDSLGVADASVSLNGDIGAVSFGSSASFSRVGTDLALTGATASLSISGGDFSIDAAARATFVSNQLDSMTVEARIALTSLSMEVGLSVEHLLTDPSWQVTLRAFGDWGSVHAFFKPTGFGIGFGIPIP